MTYHLSKGRWGIMPVWHEGVSFLHNCPYFKIHKCFRRQNPSLTCDCFGFLVLLFVSPRTYQGGSKGGGSRQHLGCICHWTWYLFQVKQYTDWDRIISDEEIRVYFQIYIFSFFGLQYLLNWKSLTFAVFSLVNFSVCLPWNSQCENILIFFIYYFLILLIFSMWWDGPPLSGYLLPASGRWILLGMVVSVQIQVPFSKVTFCCCLRVWCLCILLQDGGFKNWERKQTYIL